MNTHTWRLAVAIAVVLISRDASAQHEAHQGSGARTPSPEIAQCLRVQPAIANVITGATARAEAARLSNSPSELRAAVDHLEAALRDIRAQSSPCAAAAASSDPHAGHTMPSASTASQPAPAKPSEPAAADPHAGHKPSKPSTPAKAAPTAKPQATKPAQKAADPHAGHSAAPSGDKQRDPVNGLMVDPATAPKTTYQGQTYYFSSDQSRKEFLANPAKFAKKPKG